MEIKDLNSLGLPQKIEKAPADEIKARKSESAKNRKSQKSEAAEKTEKVNRTDKIEISEEAQKLQRSEDEVKVARQLLAKLPSYRAHVIYQALAKLKAGVYSDEQIMAEVAAKLIEGGELDDLL